MISTISLRGKTIEARDGRIGSVEDVFFDDQQWQVRYLAADTGRWLPGREVLIAPEAILQAWHGQFGIPVNLTKDQVKACPPIETVASLSRSAEELLYRHYGWTPYWGMPGDMLVPDAEVVASLEELRQAADTAAAPGDPHLRSAVDLIGCPVQAADGDVGGVQDVLIEDEHNRIGFLVVATEAGRKVLLPPEWIAGIEEATSTVRTNVSRQDIESRPVYLPAA